MIRSNSREHEDEENNQHQHHHHHHHHHNIVNLNHEQQQEQEQQQQRRSWATAFRNPRIVRVSRTFGGKDRHSKVCTVRGLRDRRIRLSVMTAIQLYDLQDRLGLNQPSKVIDWLLEAAQNDVDLLPPLQFPPGFHQNYQSYPENNNNNQLGLFQSFDLGDCSSSRKESLDLEKGKSIKFDNRDHGFDIDHHYFPNSTQSHKLYNNNNFPPDTAYNSSSSHQYDIGHLQLQQSLLDQSSNVTVAFSNVHHHHHHTNINLMNPPLPLPLPLPQPPQASDESQAFPATMSSLFPTYPSFLGAAQLQLFGSNSNNSKQRDI